MKKFIAAFILTMAATTLTTLPASATTTTEIIAKGKVVAFHLLPSSEHTRLIVVYKGTLFTCRIRSPSDLMKSGCSKVKWRK